MIRMWIKTRDTKGEMQWWTKSKKGEIKQKGKENETSVGEREKWVGGQFRKSDWDRGEMCVMCCF